MAECKPQPATAVTRGVRNLRYGEVSAGFWTTKRKSMFDERDLFMQKRGSIVTMLLHVFRHALFLRRHQRLLLGFFGGML
jgi:hypothetical protein